jgi:multiple antibiotic resistance protein
MQHFLTDFVTLLVVVNPIGKLPIFLSTTAGMNADRRQAIAVRAVVIAFCVLVFFIVAGQILLDAMGIGLASFRLAGSLVLLLFALGMIFDTASRPPPEATGPEPSDTERAVFPLAIPGIAGPGTMLAVVVLTDNDRFSLAEQAQTAITLGLVLLISWGVMLTADPVVRVIRRAGASIVSRVMGLILASLAVDGMVQAVTGLLRRALPALP